MTALRIPVAVLLVLCCASMACGQSIPSVPVSELAKNSSYVNRTNLNDALLPPYGCLTFSVTAAGSQGECIAATTADIMQTGVTSRNDYARHNISTDGWFNQTKYEQQSANCSGPSIVQIYETTGCILAQAAKETVGLGNTNILQSYVCTNQGTDTTAYTGLWGYTNEELALCKAVQKLAATNNPVTLESSGTNCPKRLTYVVNNPCNANMTVLMQNRYTLGFTDVPVAVPVSAPIVSPDAAPALAPATAPLPSKAVAPAKATVPAVAPAVAPAKTVAQAPAPSTARNTTAASPSNGAGAVSSSFALVILAASAALLI